MTSCLDWILRNSFWNIWVYQEFKVYFRSFSSLLWLKSFQCCAELVSAASSALFHQPTTHDPGLLTTKLMIDNDTFVWDQARGPLMHLECPAPDEVSPGRRKANPTTALLSTNRSLLATGISIHPTTFLPDPVEFVVVVESRTFRFLFWSTHSPLSLGDYVFPFSNLPRDA